MISPTTASSSLDKLVSYVIVLLQITVIVRAVENKLHKNKHRERIPWMPPPDPIINEDKTIQQ